MNEMLKFGYAFRLLNILPYCWMFEMPTVRLR